MGTPSMPSKPESPASRWVVLALSTVAFTLLFNVWLMLGVLGPKLKETLGLSAPQVEWLIAAAIFAGALPRLTFGIWADKYGGRDVMVALLLLSALGAYLFSRSTTYPGLLACTLLFGLAGNSFTSGISWNSSWFPPSNKGLALGVFGAGNVGASGTKLLLLLLPGLWTIVPAAGYLGGWFPGGWRALPAAYAVSLVAMAAVLALLSPGPDKKPGRGRPLADVLGPLREPRVWRFSLYYVVVFGAYVALSGWLPSFYKDTYKITLRAAALLTATFIFPASLLRPVGGWLSDKYGPRVVTYAVFISMSVALLALCLPYRNYLGVDYRLGPTAFAALMFVVGCGMGIGKASVYKYVPDYYPNDVGAVGGLVGALGALGGFVLPPVFGMIGRATGVPQSAFAALLVLTLASLAWLHLAVLGIRARGQGAPKLAVDALA